MHNIPVWGNPSRKGRGNQKGVRMESSVRQKGRFSWNELLSKDVEGAIRFYTELFGWTTETMEAPGGDYTVFKTDGEQVGGLWRMTPEVEQAGTPSYWGAYVTVDDVEATAEKAKQLGATVLVEPMEVANVGRFCTIRDPEGAVVSFIQYE